MAIVKVKKVGIEKKRGHLYFIDKEGDISTVARGETKKVAQVGIEREEGFYYFIDKEGDISRARMARGGAFVKGTKK